MIQYRTSSYCSVGGCVEVGQAADGTVVVRDAKDPHRSKSLVFDRTEWAAFVAGVKAGEFDVAR
jgi:hypothetical protein